jgi:hypothetical protein
MFAAKPAQEAGTVAVAAKHVQAVQAAAAAAQGVKKLKGCLCNGIA